MWGSIGVIAVLCFIGSVRKAKQYADARDAFLENPTSVEVRQRLLKAGRGRGHDNSTSEIMSLFQAAEDDAKSKGDNSKFVPDLKILAELHNKGMLTDKELERAKKRLTT